MSSAYSNDLPGDQAALDANRYGQLTPWQRQQIKPPSVVGSLLVIGMVCAFMVPVGLLVFLPLGLRVLEDDAPPLAGLILLGIVGFFLLVLGPILLVPALDLRTKLRLRRDLAEGYIAQEDGQVIFTNSHGYMARVAGRALRDMDGSKAVNLAPGSYRFYYLPRSGRILSAERQTLFDPGGPQAGLLLALSQAHHFSLDELDTNRLGHVSGRQRGRLVSKLVFLVVIAAALVIGSIWQSTLVLQNGPWSFLVLAAVAFFLLMLTYQRWLDLLGGRVAMVEGFVQREEHSSGDDGSTYYYNVGGEQFMVNGVAYQALVPGERYRLYYLPHSKKLVSIEPL